MSDHNTEKSPNSFEPPQPKDGGSKKTFNLIIGILAAMALIVVWSLSSGTGEKKEKPKEKSETSTVETRNLIPGEDSGRGVAGKAFPKPPEKAGLVDLPPDQSSKDNEQMQFVGPPPVDRDDEAQRLEQEEERRKKREAYYSGLGSNIMVLRTGASSEPIADEPGNRGEDSGIRQGGEPGSPEGYNPAADIDKEGFFERADARQWRSPYTREAGQKYELKTGTVIPGIMVTGVNSDLPGTIIAQVSHNVYDTATGNQLLIPQGAKIYGTYDSRVVYGQSRVLVAWNRIIFPDGSSVTLGAMPGADLAGYAGFGDKVDNHYLRIFGSAAVMSLITGGMSYAMDKVDNNNKSNDNSTSMQDEMTSALASQMGQATMKLLEKNLSIKPTLEIRPGFRFNLVVTKDIVFRGAYVASR